MNIVALYRKIPRPIASCLAAIFAWGIAFSFGMLSAGGAVYLYDRGKNDARDLAVGMTALFSVGTFLFVVLFSGLQRLHHEISARTPRITLAVCLAVAAAATALLWDRNYALWVLAGWLILLCGSVLAFQVSKRIAAYPPAREAAEDAPWNGVDQRPRIEG
ncbi:MAG TPA: hypothetical protein VEG08_05455 [Terriglobales bacterium]|nr:hypothetical protein [Terriglobales bacterium]